MKFRFALPTSRFCIAIIAKEEKETYLEALLNCCRQWYSEREKVLGSPQKIKNSARPRFTAFMAFLTEMFCQLKRRQLQLRTKCDGVPPPIVLLTVLSKCCEDCVTPPVRSLSEVKFFMLFDLIKPNKIIIIFNEFFEKSFHFQYKMIIDRVSFLCTNVCWARH